MAYMATGFEPSLFFMRGYVTDTVGCTQDLTDFFAIGRALSRHIISRRDMLNAHNSHAIHRLHG